MWELPRVTRGEGENAVQALARLGRELAVKWQANEVLTALKHGVTRYQIELECWRVAEVEVEARDDLRWFALEEALQLPLPSTMKKLLHWAQKHGDETPRAPVEFGRLDVSVGNRNFSTPTHALVGAIASNG